MRWGCAPRLRSCAKRSSTHGGGPESFLIFLALFEHRAVILADEAINRAVPEGQWQSLVDELVAGIKSGRPAAALITTIGRCGEVLEEHHVALRPDDEDELADAPRLRER
jgi:uncharacterized membrane protein